jgi:hypothetical protein
MQMTADGLQVIARIRAARQDSKQAQADKGADDSHGVSVYDAALMLYKFKSKNTGDLIMLQPNGRRVLEIIGKVAPDEPANACAQGILQAQQMSAAIAALEAAIVKEEADQKAAVADALAHNEPPPRFEAISLRQRCQPFIAMLHQCEKDGHEVIWGV